MCLKLEKSCFTVFTNKHIEVMPNLKINNIYLSFYSETKFLKIVIDSKLLFAKHISVLCSQISLNIGLLKSMKYFLPMSIVKKTLLHYCASAHNKWNRGVG